MAHKSASIKRELSRYEYLRAHYLVFGFPPDHPMIEDIREKERKLLLDLAVADAQRIANGSIVRRIILSVKTRLRLLLLKSSK